jgi:hypothetical protein
VAPLDAINLVVSDDALSPTWRDRITSAGPELRIAAVEEPEHAAGTHAANRNHAS